MIERSSFYTVWMCEKLIFFKELFYLLNEHLVKCVKKCKNKQSENFSYISYITFVFTHFLAFCHIYEKKPRIAYDSSAGIMWWRSS